MPRQIPEVNPNAKIPEVGGFGSSQKNAKNLIHFGPEELASIGGLNHCWKSASELEIAVAIALAESAGNTNAENHNTNGTVDRGLWQVNSVHGFTGNLFDPAYNVLAACSVYKSQGWGAWSTYKSGAYKQYLPQAKKGVAEYLKTGATENVEGLLEPFGGPHSEGALEGAAKAALSWTTDLGKILGFLLTSSGWLRIGKVLVGTILLLIALDQLSKLAGGPSVPQAGELVPSPAKAAKPSVGGVKAAKVAAEVAK